MDLIKQSTGIEDDKLARSVRKQKAQLYLDENLKKLFSFRNKNWAESRVLFDSLRKILFYINDERFNLLLEKLYWELEKDNFDKEFDREVVYKSYIRSRQFEKAAVYYKKLPEWQVIDLIKAPKVSFEIENPESPALMKVSGVNSLVVQKFPIEEYSGMIIVGSPNCGWTNRALREIQSAKALQLNKIKLIAPQEGLELKAIYDWNKKYPLIPYNIVYKEAAFKGFTFDTVPYFYFLKNGKVVSQFSGWPEEGNWLQLKSGLKKI